MFHFSFLPVFLAWTRLWWQRCASRLQIRKACCLCPRQLCVPSVHLAALPGLEQSLVWDRTLDSLGAAPSCGTVVPHLPANVEDAGDAGSVPGSGWSLKEEMATYSSVLAWSGPRSLAGYSPCGRKESDTTDHTHSPQLWVGVESQGRLRQRTDELGRSGTCLAKPLTWSRSKCSINDHFNSSSSSACAQHLPCFVLLVLQCLAHGQQVHTYIMWSYHRHN